MIEREKYKQERKKGGREETNIYSTLTLCVVRNGHRNMIPWQRLRCSPNSRSFSSWAFSQLTSPGSYTWLHLCAWVPADGMWLEVRYPTSSDFKSLSNLLLQLFPCLAYLDGADAQGDLESHLLKVAQLLATCYLEGEVCCQRGTPALS